MKKHFFKKKGRSNAEELFEGVILKCKINTKKKNHFLSKIYEKIVALAIPFPRISLSSFINKYPNYTCLLIPKRLLCQMEFYRLVLLPRFQ